MRAVQLISPKAPLASVDLADPSAGPGHVLVRVDAAGICHSDAHYRAGEPATATLPITLGHEIAGTIVDVGTGVDGTRVGERVGVHYVVSDGTCGRCTRYGEQFCENYAMYGLTTNGGYAELIAVPAGNAVPVPEGVSTDHAAVMMCSSVTSLHALRQGRLRGGETVAVFGAGGLGLSAVQLALALGAKRVFAVDIDEERLRVAADLGADSIPASSHPARRIREADDGADVVLVLVDKAEVFEEAMLSLARTGRLVSVGISTDPVPLVPYRHLIGRETELIGSNDHTLSEIHELFDFATRGLLRLDAVVTGAIPLEADAVNEALDRLEGFGPGARTVIKP